MNIKKNMAENIRDDIYRRNMTQRAYATMAGIPYNTLLYIISGGSISLNTLMKLAKGTGLSPLNILGERN